MAPNGMALISAGAGQGPDLCPEDGPWVRYGIGERFTGAAQAPDPGDAAPSA
jgi:hypothetical protein